MVMVMVLVGVCALEGVPATINRAHATIAARAALFIDVFTVDTFD
jgi:hypothetical protein